MRFVMKDSNNANVSAFNNLKRSAPLLLSFFRNQSLTFRTTGIEIQNFSVKFRYKVKKNNIQFKKVKKNQ